MMVDADLGTAQAGEVFFGLVGAGTVEADRASSSCTQAAKLGPNQFADLHRCSGKCPRASKRDDDMSIPPMVMGMMSCRRVSDRDPGVGIIGMPMSA
jgi:hypothetical protein